MKNWGFATGQGNEITRGWQGTEAQARAKAQQWANERDDSIDFWCEPNAGAAETVEPIPSMGDTFVMVGCEAYLTNTEDEIATARQALTAAGLEKMPIWHGVPDDPSAYLDNVHVLFAAHMLRNGDEVQS